MRILPPIAAASAALGLAACQNMDGMSGNQSAMSDPVIEDEYQGLRSYGQWVREVTGTFRLDSMEDVDIIKYTSPRDVTLCLQDPDISVADTQTMVPLAVSWDGTNTAVIAPGNCLYFDAQRVQVSPAAQIDPGAVIQGSINTTPSPDRMTGPG